MCKFRKFFLIIEQYTSIISRTLTIFNTKGKLLTMANKNYIKNRYTTFICNAPAWNRLMIVFYLTVIFLPLMT